MDCQGCQDLLVDFLYGELDPDARRAFQAHLDACDACAKEAEQLGQVLSLVRAHPEEAPADDLSQRILHAARAATDHRAHQAAAARKPAWWRWLLSPAPMTAVLALVVVSVGLAVYVSGPTPGVGPAAPAGPAGPKAAAEVAPADAPAASARPEWDEAPLEQAKDSSATTGREASAKRMADLAPATPSLDAARGSVGQPGQADAPATEPAPAKARKRRRAGLAKPASKAKKAEKPKATRGVLGGTLAQGDQKQDRASAAAQGPGGAKLSGAGSTDGLALGKGVGGAGGVRGALRRPMKTDLDEAKPADKPAAPKPQPKPAQTAMPPPPRARFAAPPPSAEASADAEERPEEREAMAEKKAPARTPRAAPTAAAPVDSMAHQAAGDMGADGAEDVRVMEEAIRSGADDRATARRAQAPDVDLYAQAERALARKEYAVAALGYRTFLSEHPGDARAATARFRLARALFLAGRCAQAVQATQRAVGAAPRHRLAADALFDQASCHVRLGQFAAAQRVYRRIQRDHPGRASEASREAARIAPVDAAPAAAPASER